jgi:hypothetical protein
MANTDEPPVRPRGPMRIDGQTTLSLFLVIALVGGAVQYGRQSERLDLVERELVKVTEKLDKLTESVNALRLTTSAGR